MKKFLCILLITALIFSGIIAFAEDDNTDLIEFDPVLTEIFDKTAAKWFADETSRALLSVLISLDIMNTFDGSNEQDEFVPNFLKSSYVGKGGFDLSIIFCTDENELVLITYRPITDEAGYYVLPVGDVAENLLEIAIESTLESTCKDGYYKNDLEEIVTALTELQDTLESLVS